MSTACRYIACLGLACLWLIMAAAVLANGQSAAPDATLSEAIESYRAAMDSASRDERLRLFQRAELLFARLASGPSGVRNANLYSNLGNAALQAEHLGLAVLSYRRALHIEPGHRQARQNLEYARSLLPDWVPRAAPAGNTDTFFVWAQRFSLRERWLLAAVVFLIGSVLLAAAMRWERPLFRNVAVLGLVAWTLLLAATLWQQLRPPLAEAVVTRSDAIARAADATNAPARFSEPLPGGTEVQVELQRDGWAHVRLADGRDGWLRSSDLGFVCDHPNKSPDEASTQLNGGSSARQTSEMSENFAGFRVNFGRLSCYNRDVA